MCVRFALTLNEPSVSATWLVIALSVSRNCFLFTKRHYSTELCKAEAFCFLRGRSRLVKYYLCEIHRMKCYSDLEQRECY